MKPLVRLWEQISGPPRLNILIFHRVLPVADPTAPSVPDAEKFRQIIRMTKRLFRILPLNEALNLARQNKLPPGSAAITFDDGYADNHSVALPVLREEQAPATIYIATKYLNGGRMFNDTISEAFRGTTTSGIDLSPWGLEQVEFKDLAHRRATSGKVIMKLKYLDPQAREDAAEQISELLQVRPRRDLMMTSETVAALPPEWITVGAHTHSHPILTRLEPAEVEKDIRLGRRILQDLTGTPVDLFAYPNGKRGDDYDERHVQLVREIGFSSAVTTSPGVHTATGDYYQIPRFTPWHSDFVRFSLMMLRNGLSNS